MSTRVGLDSSYSHEQAHRKALRAGLPHMPPLSSTLTSEWDVHPAFGNSSARAWKAELTEEPLPIEGVKELVV